MSVTQDIVVTYWRPRKVIAKLLSMGTREDRALAILIAACTIIFIAQWPRLAREAHLTGQELNPMLGGALMAWLFIAPLLAYTLAFITQIVARLLGGKQSPYGARLALFWAMLASSPINLLYGLVGGFIGAGVALNAVGIVWLGLISWFWIAGFFQAGKAEV